MGLMHFGCDPCLRLFDRSALFRAEIPSGFVFCMWSDLHRESNQTLSRSSGSACSAGWRSLTSVGRVFLVDRMGPLRSRNQGYDHLRASFLRSVGPLGIPRRPTLALSLCAQLTKARLQKAGGGRRGRRRRGRHRPRFRNVVPGAARGRINGRAFWREIARARTRWLVRCARRRSA